MKLAYLLLCPALFTLLTLSCLAQETSNMPLDELRAKASGGDAEAEFQLAKDYEKGNLFSLDYAKARELYAASANQGNPKAMTNLASLLMRGLGGAKDPKTASQLYRKAAEKGAVLAETAYASMLQDGVAGPSDLKGAFEWFQKAAAQGQPTAQYQLGLIYLYGNRAVKADPSKALPLISGLAKKFRPDAENVLGYMYETGKGVNKDRQQATFWYDASAKQGYSRGQVNRGRMCFAEDGKPLDVVTGFMWFTLAAEQFDPMADHYMDDFKLLISPDQLTLAHQRAAAFKAKPVNPPSENYANLQK